MANNWESTWAYKDKHVESDIETNEFVASSRCLIYAAPYTKITDTTKAQLNRSTFERIGVVQGWNWGENRQIELIFELGSEVPYLIPGRTTGQISVSRLMLFGRDLTNMIYRMAGATPGTPFDPTNPATFIKSIREINKPFDLMFAAFNNLDGTDTNGVALNKVYSRVYTGCWLQSKNESISSGQILIAENVNIMYESVVSVTIPISG